MTLKALIFDVDGTLADTERDGHRTAFNRAFEDAGLEWRWDESLYGRLLVVAGGKERIRFYVERCLPDYRKPSDFDDLVTRLHAAKTEHFNRLLRRDGIPPRPGVRRLLREARLQGTRLAIATTSMPENVIALLRHALSTEAETWFEVIGAGDVVAAKKPAPDIYYYVLERLNLDPDRCMAFEDSAHGLRAARAAGLKTIVAVNDYTNGQDFADAAIVLDHFGEAGRPFQILSGTSVNGATYLDMALVRRLHAVP